MELGIVGIGRMGAFMAQRLMRAGHTVYGYARTRSSVDARVQDGSIKEGATSLEDLVSKISASPRIIWLMVLAASVDATLETLIPVLDSGDIVVDGGKTFAGDHEPFNFVKCELVCIGPLKVPLSLFRCERIQYRGIVGQTRQKVGNVLDNP